MLDHQAAHAHHDALGEEVYDDDDDDDSDDNSDSYGQ